MFVRVYSCKGGLNVRIISGKRRGYKLLPPVGDNTRPTTDRVKESLFNIIQMRFPCLNILDLFAGSGALGIEALSRGAAHAVFVEHDAEAYNVVRKNLLGSGFDADASLYKADSLKFLDGLYLGGFAAESKSENKFDIIFLDPPYNKGLLKPTLEKIYSYSLLSDNGIIVVETEAGGEDITDTKFNIIKSAKYGKTVITIMQR